MALSGIQVSRILHAGYLLECAGQRIIFDPLIESPFSHNCYSYPPVTFDLESFKSLHFDAIFISHFHDDHCSLESLQHFKKETPIYLFCLFPEIKEVLLQLGFKNIIQLELQRTYQVGEFKITAYPALDEDVDSIFHIEAQGLNILNVVDSWIPPETLKTLEKVNWDLVLWPFQLMQELKVLSPTRAKLEDSTWPSEFDVILEKLKFKSIVPSSCQFIFEEGSWLNKHYFPISYLNFSSIIKKLKPQTNVLRLDPGASIQLLNDDVKRGDRLSWVWQVQEGVFDYEFDPSFQVPSSREVSMWLPVESMEQSQFAHQFCEIDLPQRLAQLGPGTSDYFEVLRLWHLQVFSASGTYKDYFFEIFRYKIKRVNHSTKPVAWKTEISELKLACALLNGESLSSLYLRINDQIFCDEIEEDLKEIDLTEDPLVRSIYSEAVGHYQRAQLKRML